MPKNSSRGTINSRLARRLKKVDPKRSDLLEKILNESSSISLNDVANQTNAKQALEHHSRLLDLIGELRQVESALNPQLPERTEDNWLKFFSWVDAEQGSEFSKTLKVGKRNSKHDESDYSLLARVTIAKDETVFRINRKVMLSTETAMQDQSLYDFIKTDTIASSMQNVVLALHLLNEHSKGELSYWAPYIAILPNSILPVLKLDKEILKNLLTCSHVFEILKMIRAISRQYSYFFARLQALNLPLCRNFTFDYYCWGVSMVCSRQNEIPPIDRKTSSLATVHALIPVLDMCNHDHLSNQAIYEGNHSSLTVAKKLNVDEEISINYGTRSSGDFYIHNGFVPKELPHDTVPITFSISNQDNLIEAKCKLLKILNMPMFGRFRLTLNNRENRNRRDPHLTMFLIVYLMNEQELNHVLNSSNPVGIADKIYEYVQYEQQDVASLTITKDKDDLEVDRVLQIQQRIASSIKEFTSKRASIAIALINRTISESNLLDDSIMMLLKHEKTIYESYLINCSAK